MKRAFIVLLSVGLMVFATSCATHKQKTETQTWEQKVTSPEEVTYKYNDSDFVTDVTIADGTEMQAGAKFDKTWRITNSGTKNWKNYKLVFDGGDQMGAPDSVSVKTTPPEQEVDITVPMKAPKNPGAYTGYWKMKSDDGELFGVRIWVMIEVN